MDEVYQFQSESGSIFCFQGNLRRYYNGSDRCEESVFSKEEIQVRKNVQCLAKEQFIYKEHFEYLGFIFEESPVRPDISKFLKEGFRINSPHQEVLEMLLKIARKTGKIESPAYHLANRFSIGSSPTGYFGIERNTHSRGCGCPLASLEEALATLSVWIEQNKKVEFSIGDTKFSYYKDSICFNNIAQSMQSIPFATLEQLYLKAKELKEKS